MCPLYPFHFVLLYLCLLLPLLLAVVEGVDELLVIGWKARFSSADRGGRVNKLQQFNSTDVTFECYDCPVPAREGRDGSPADLSLVLQVKDPHIARIDREIPATIDDDSGSDGQEVVLDLEQYRGRSNFSLNFVVTGRFLGFTKITPRIKNGDKLEEFSGTKPDRPLALPVSITRKKTIQSKLFSYSVAALVSIAYINMGCAFDLQVVKDTLKRPVGPAIGFVSQFVLMPLLSFGLGFIYPSEPMRLGLFVTGASPGGGASNIWTIMFGGNLELSVTMTAVSTFAAFFMMPLWIYTLGEVILANPDLPIDIPYYKICIYAFMLVVPLCIGMLINRYLPRVSKFLVRILKPLALFLILFILIFGVWANLYIFKIMTWQVWLTGMGLPWLGFLFGWFMAMAFRRPYPDVIAIAIETGVQNTGMSIFILWFTLDHPLGDITAVVPVAAATMTPLPLLFGLAVMKLRTWSTARKSLPANEEMTDEDLGTELPAAASAVADADGKDASLKLMSPAQQQMHAANFVQPA